MMHGESLQARIWAHGVDRTVAASYDKCEFCRCWWHGLPCRSPGCGCQSSWVDTAEDGAA